MSAVPVLRQGDLKSAVTLVAIVLVLFVVSVVTVSLLMSLDLSAVFSQVYESTVGTEFGILSVLRRTTYFLIVSLGLSVAFSSGVWNIGGEGQILWGALLATAVALLVALPAPELIPLALVASFMAGALWGLISGFLKAKWNVNEIVSTMMLNFVATATMTQIAGGPLRDPVVLIAQTKMIPEELQFPFILYPLNVAFLFALALVPLVYVLMHKSVLGYKMRILGGSSTVAAAAGINTRRMILISMFVSGGICALAGSMLVFGHFFRAQAAMTGLFGFYAIVSTLLGKSKPELMFFTSLLLSFIITGTESLRVLGVPGPFTQLVVGLMFIAAVLREFYSRRIK
jgi:ABC-type uncharacterized transport system permease subunit